MAATDGDATGMISFDTPQYFGKGDWTAEIHAMKTEMERLRRLKQEERTALSAENDLLQRRLDDTKTQLKLMNDTLTHSTVRYNMALNANRQHKEDLTQRLENERKIKEKLQTEVDLLTSDLRSALTELREMQTTSFKHDKLSEDEKEKWRDLAEERSHDLEIARKLNKELEEKMHSLTDQMSKATTELRLLKLVAEDRENQLVRLQKDLEQRSSQLDYITEQFRNQKEENIRLQVKVESQHDRIKDSQNVVASMQRRLNEEQEKIRKHEEKILRLTSNIAECDRVRSSLEERIREQRETIEGLKDDVRFAQNGRESTLDELRSAQDIWANRQTEVMSIRLALESANSSKFGLETELLDMKRLAESKSKKLEDMRKQNVELQQKLSSANKARAAETARREVQESSSCISFDGELEGIEQRWPFDAAYAEKFVREEDVRRLNEENLRLLSAHEEEKNKNGGLLKKQSRNSDLQSKFKLSLTEIKEAVSKLDEAQQRNINLAKDVTSLKEQLKKAKKRIKELEESVSKGRSSSDGKDDSTVKQLENLCHSYQKALSAEIEAKLKAEKDLSNYKNSVQKVYVQKAEMEAVVSKVKAFSQAEVSARMEEVSAYLKEQMRARETLERLRSCNELEIRKCHEQEREELQCELSRMRKSNVELISEKASLELELMKYQRLGGRETKDAQAPSQRMMHAICDKTKSDQTDDGFHSCKAKEDGDAADSRLRQRAEGGSSSRGEGVSAEGGGCSISRGGGGGVSSGLLRLATCDAFAHKVLFDLDRSIAKHLEKPGQLESTTGTTGSCGH